MFLRRQPSWNTAFFFIQLWEKYHEKLIFYIQHAVYFIYLLMSRRMMEKAMASHSSTLA